MEKKFHEMNIVGCIRQLPIIRISDDLDIASFVLLGDAELVVKAAAELVKRIPEADYLITAEAKGIPSLSYEKFSQSMDSLADFYKLFIQDNDSDEN